MISPMFDKLLVPYLAAMILAMTMGGSGTAPAFSAAFCTCNKMLLIIINNFALNVDRY